MYLCIYFNLCLRVLAHILIVVEKLLNVEQKREEVTSASTQMKYSCNQLTQALH